MLTDKFQSAIEGKFLYSSYKFNSLVVRARTWICVCVYILHRVCKQFEIDDGRRLIISVYVYFII